ncbi:CheR family methyltransferase [Arenibacterium sp. LLYu02]|uniref:CheR family methyltransferase n=1 Tax=Arenibacterium sp. LLYu02 TaxID=3404132 RepID=UPI003B20C498
MSSDDKPFLVGIAASAGGLEALSELVEHLGQQDGASYVIAQHMSPKHKSMLSALLARETKLPVAELTDAADIDPEPNTIYVVMPGFDVVVSEGGKLGLREPEGQRGQPKPLADRLFKTMAEEYGENCAAIVLSGTGSDGSYGVRAIREVGGITIAQDPESSKYSGMPASALQTGCVDLTLSAGEIGTHLGNILRQPRDFSALQELHRKPHKLSDLFQILSARTGVDFREYKATTINRRIARRMLARGFAEYNAYVDFCRRDLSEVDALYKDLMISVTRFFRDPQQFEALRDSIRELVERLDITDQRTIRVWVAGCATGEEAYSVAILFLEAMGGIEKVAQRRLQVFATDIDQQALDQARRGEYPISATSDIPDELLDRYFIVRNETIEVKKALRAFVLFSRHNVIQDPPFTNLDCITLRNLLIYFNGPLQDKVLARIGYALIPKGILFLGAAETIGGMDNLFEVTNHSDRIYRKRVMVRRPAMQDFLRDTAQDEATQALPLRFIANKERTRASGRQFDSLIRVLAPNGFLASNNGAILRIIGDISFVTALTERTGLQVDLKILIPDLRSEASSLINVALRSRSVRSGQWHGLTNSPHEQVRLTCYPIAQQNEDTGESSSVVLFAVETRLKEQQTGTPETLEPEEQEQYIRQIEDEVVSTREALQQTIEELQTANEELQSVNEEMQAANEELQSTNEELETSNEELQSTNEELITVNEEIQVNSTEIQHVTAELSAVLRANPFVMIVVDQALQVRHASRRALSMFELEGLPKSGVHIGQCAPVEGMPDLTSRISQVFRTRKPLVERAEFGGGSHEMTFTPFQQKDGRELLGVAVTIV